VTPVPLPGCSRLRPLHVKQKCLSFMWSSNFRPEFPEVSPRNKVFAALKSGAMPFLESESAMEIHNDLAPEPSDIVVTQRRVSGFAGSDLEVVLRAQGIEHIVLAGISNEWCCAVHAQGSG